MHLLHRVKLFAIPVLLLALPIFSGCSQDSPANETPQAPLPEVAVTVVTPQNVTITTELSGRISAHLVAEIRPRVGGIIQKRLFTEGADVKAGQVLYQLDAASYRAVYDSAAAALAKAEAALIPARLKAERLGELVKMNAVSQQDYDDSKAAYKLAEAEVAAAKAALQTARINLDYTAIKAPISGRIGRSRVTTGALVTASQDAPLATIQQLDPVYVDLTQSSSELLRMKRELANGGLKNSGLDQAKVQLLLEDGSRYEQAGTLKFSDVTVNQSTGSVTLRTVFPNPQQLLLPGMYVRAILETGVMDQAILVPQKGVTRDPAGRATALVVGADDRVEARLLKVDRAIGDQWLIIEGLQAGDRLVVEGLQKIRPGATVRVAVLDNPPAAVAVPAVARQ